MNETPSHRLRLSLLPQRYSVCRLAADAEVSEWGSAGWEDVLFSITRTADELSLVCLEANVPTGAVCEPGWRVLRLEGPFAFDLVGVLLAVLTPLAQAGVSVFTLSTFDTDYVLVKETSLPRAVSALESVGHVLVLQ